MVDDAEIGRVVRERKQAQDKIAELRSHLDNLGSQLRELSGLLRTKPESIKFEGVSFPAEYLNQPLTFKIEAIDGKAIANSVTSLREWLEKSQRLNEHAKRLGV